VIALEGLLGTQLFERKPGAFALTDAGAALLPVVRKSFDRIEQALNDIVNEDGAKARTLRVQLPPTFAHLLAVPILREFRRVCPDVILDIESAHNVGFPARDTDIAVIYAKPQVSDRVSNLLWMERLTPMCHPDVAAHARGLDLGAFLAETELLHGKLENEPRNRMWHMLVRQAGLKTDVERGLVFDTTALAAQYARSGEGVALLDLRMFAAEIGAGRLVAPYDIVLEAGYGYHLTIHPEDLADPAIAQFRSWMVKRFGMDTAAPAAFGASPLRVVAPPPA
jgi:DNA-binding transcriptional LysR family regulator